ncbi:hypothetical protein [Geopsychrobacter electrodiphilus]|uniref:hypothetical protein n=1 Tax=Geopsychrobacter electrodiphilus TaxID=225196 RepID=UPI00037A7CE1|nr:hypothetical protein [Geopsychrobacter electrodiphilus]
MKIFKSYRNKWIMTLFMLIFAAGCSNSNHISISSARVTNAKAITTYSLNGADGIIDESAKTISVTMPTGTNLTALTATYTTTGKSLAVGPTQQISGGTPNDFTAPLSYTVTATDSSTAIYTISASVAPSEAKARTSFSPSGVTGAINETTKTIVVAMPTGADQT